MKILHTRKKKEAKKFKDTPLISLMDTQQEVENFFSQGL